MDSETWRVVLESGEVREVAVTREPRAWTARAASGDEGASGISARRAVQLLAGAPNWPVREILAPGEATAEDRVQRAARDGVLRGLTVARENAVAMIDGATGLPIIDWTDTIVATGDALAASKAVPA